MRTVKEHLLQKPPSQVSSQNKLLSTWFTAAETSRERTANTEDNARLDIKAHGLWVSKWERDFFDVRAFNTYTTALRIYCSKLQETREGKKKKSIQKTSDENWTWHVLPNYSLYDRWLGSFSIHHVQKTGLLDFREILLLIQLQDEDDPHQNRFLTYWLTNHVLKRSKDIFPHVHAWSTTPLTLWSMRNGSIWLGTWLSIV